MTEITYQLTEEDYWEAYRLWRGKTTAGRFKVGYVLLLGALVPVIIFHGQFWKVWFSDWTLLLMACVPVGLMLFMVAMLLWVMPRRGMKRLMSSEDSRNPVVFRWDAEGLGFKATTTEARVTWAGVKRWWEGAGVFVIVREQVMSPVPKRAMTEEQVSELRGLLREKVG